MGQHDSARHEAHYWSMLTRQTLRTPPVEDPTDAVDRMLHIVRTEPYAKAYNYLKHPVHVQAPEREKEKRRGQGGGYMLGSLLFAPLWFVSVPLFAVGITKALMPPDLDDAKNQRHRKSLIARLDVLKRSVQAEIEEDRTRARRIRSRLSEQPVSSMASVSTPDIAPPWRLLFYEEAVRVIPKGRGWIQKESGTLLIGEASAAFFSESGKLIELPLEALTSSAILHQSILVPTFDTRFGSVKGLLLVTRTYEAGAYLENAARLAREKAMREKQAHQSVIAKAANNVLAPLRRLGRKKKSED